MAVILIKVLETAPANSEADVFKASQGESAVSRVETLAEFTSLLSFIRYSVSAVLLAKKFHCTWAYLVTLTTTAFAAAGKASQKT